MIAVDPGIETGFGGAGWGGRWWRCSLTCLDGKSAEASLVQGRRKMKKKRERSGGLTGARGRKVLNRFKSNANR